MSVFLVQTQTYPYLKKSKNASAARHENPSTRVASDKALPSEKPLPSIPPGAVAANNVAGIAARSLIDAEEAPLRRPMAGNPDTQEEWPALLPLKVNTLSRAEAKQLSSDFEKPVLAPAPLRPASNCTIPSLVNCYDTGPRASRHLVPIKNWSSGSQDHTQTTFTSVTGNPFPGLRHTASLHADSQSLIPFANTSPLEYRSVDSRRASEPVHPVTHAGLGLSQVFSASLNTSTRPQTRNPFLDPLNSQALTTNTSVLLQPNQKTCPRPASSDSFPFLPYPFEKQPALEHPDTSHPESIELHEDHTEPGCLKDQAQAAQTSQATPSHQQTTSSMDSPTGFPSSDSAGVSAVGSSTPPLERNDNAQALSRLHSDRRSSRIPRASNLSLRTSMMQSESHSKTPKNKYAAPERPSSIPVPVRTLSLPSSTSKDDVTSVPSVSHKGKATDVLADPIPENENAALTPSVIPQSYDEPTATKAEGSDEQGFMDEDEIRELQRPPTVYTGEYRVKRLSKIRLDQGPILRISSSAEKVIMGTEDDESHAVSKQESCQQSRVSITESIRASVETRMSNISIKRASLRPTSLNAQEAAKSGTRNAEETNGEKTESPNVAESPSRGRPRSQTSTEHGRKRDVSTKEMNIFRRLANRSSFSSVRSVTLIPDDAPPVPIIPAHLAATNGVDLVPSQQKVSGTKSSIAMSTPQSASQGGSAHYMSGTRSGLPNASKENETPGSTSKSGPYNDGTTRADTTPRKFPPRTSSHTPVPYVFDVEPQSVHTTTSEPDLKHFRASLRSKGKMKFPGKRKDIHPTGSTENAMNSPAESRPSGSKNSRVLENLRGIFGRQKGATDKGTTSKDDNAKFLKLKKADKRTDDTKSIKGFKGTPGTEKVHPKKGTKHSRFRMGGRNDNTTTEKADINGYSPTISKPKPIPKPRPTLASVPAHVRDRSQNGIPSFARPTQATLTRAAANARTPPTPTTATTIGATVSRTTRGLTVTATGSPLNPARVQPRTLTTNMGQMNRPSPQHQSSVSPDSLSWDIPARSTRPSNNSPFIPHSAARPSVPASPEEESLEEIIGFIAEIKRRARDETNLEKQAKLLRVGKIMHRFNIAFF